MFEKIEQYLVLRVSAKNQGADTKRDLLARVTVALPRDGFGYNVPIITLEILDRIADDNGSGELTVIVEKPFGPLVK